MVNDGSGKPNRSSWLQPAVVIGMVTGLAIGAVMGEVVFDDIMIGLIFGISIGTMLAIVYHRPRGTGKTDETEER